MNIAIAAGHPATMGNLPAESNVFIGRERDLTDLTSILDRVRAVTLCGPGGIGTHFFGNLLLSDMTRLSRRSPSERC